MRYQLYLLIIVLTVSLSITDSSAIEPPDSVAWKQQLPKALEDWKSWALWQDTQLRCPSEAHDPTQTHCVWPSKLILDLNDQGGTWQLEVHTFHHTSIVLPGYDLHWPQAVTSGTTSIPVVNQMQEPITYLPPGFHRLKGIFQWKTLPQFIRIPSDIGILNLTLNGKKIEHPEWHPANILQLHRKAETVEEEFLETKIYRLIEDGIPTWLHTQVEITVGGKSREVTLGHILPEGWKIASVEAPIPATIDNEGRLKVQVRSGKWTLHIRAFVINPVAKINYSDQHTPILQEEWIGLQQNPNFRVLEIQGLTQVDVTQTSYPEEWRKYPAFLWPTDQSFTLVEKMRGMGDRIAQGLTIQRTLWLDENGQAITYQDRIHGRRENLWRLDAAADHSLGSIKINNQNQLITRNPTTQTSGVEIRDTHLNLDAVGRILTPRAFTATGWTEDAQTLSATLHLPPGWRMITALGPDHVIGDWFSRWTLLDIFLCILIAGAIHKLFGIKAAILAVVALTITYHEPSAPRFLWLITLLPIALLKISPASQPRLQFVLQSLRWLTLALLLLGLIPFITTQIEHALFPQLEKHPIAYSQSDLYASKDPSRSNVVSPVVSPFEAQSMASPAHDQEAIEIQQSDNIPTPKAHFRSSYITKGKRADASLNQQIDARSRIQTGPGIPDWSWEQIHLRWSGPVKADQKLELLLISPSFERAIKALRVFLLALLFILISRGSLPSCLYASILSIFKMKRATMLLILLFLLLAHHPTHAQAQTPIQSFPSIEMIQELQKRLTQTTPEHAGTELARLTLHLRERRLTLEADIHTARRVAFPLPLKLDRWSPLSVTLNGRPEPPLRRVGDTGPDRELWIVLPAEGVHQIRIEGIVPEVNTWPCRFTIKPKAIQIHTEGWQATGLNSEGQLTQEEITFTREGKETPQADSSVVTTSSDYAHRDYAPALLIERHLDIGLVWKSTNTVRRLTPATSAITARIPLLNNERILSSDVTVKDNHIDIRLIAGQDTYTWESELLPSDTLRLHTPAQDLWVEQWQLLLSPMWSARFEGIAPILDSEQSKLTPRWQPWPGETVTLHLARPEAIVGDTVTLHRVSNQQEIGARQRTGRLQFIAESSMGEDFTIDLPPDTAITRLERDGSTLPVLRDNTRLTFPLTRGRQEILIEWKNEFTHTFQAQKISFPTSATNITTILNLPQDRWILWTSGPMRGPAVRFWGLLAVAFLVGWALGNVPRSPLRSREWILLSIGLTQVHLIAGFTFVAWLFLLLWRGTPSYDSLKPWLRNTAQIILLGLTFVALGILLTAIASGLIGAPQMYIAGNPLSDLSFQWFSDRTESTLPTPTVFSVSIWWYRAAMLLWSLWIAGALLRWLKWGWEQFGKNGYWHRA